MHAFEFWGASASRGWGGSVCAPGVPPRGAAVLAVRRRPVDAPAYLGSDLHISCGHELAAWEAAAPAPGGGGALRLALALGRAAAGSVWLYLPGSSAQPGAPRPARPPRVGGGAAAGDPTPAGAAARAGGGARALPDVWRVPVALRADGAAELSVRW